MKCYIWLMLILTAAFSQVQAADTNGEQSINSKFDNELVNSYYYVKNLIFTKEMISKEYFLITLLASVENELLLRKKDNKRVDFPSEEELRKLNMDLSAIRYSVDEYSLSGISGKLQKNTLEEHNLTLLRTRMLKTSLIESATPEEKLRMFNVDYKLGLKAYAAGDFDFTLFIFNEIMSIYNYKNLDDVLFYKAECLVQKNSLTEAARTFQRIIEEYPESPFFNKSFERLISVYYLKGDYDKVVNSQKIAARSGAADSVLTPDLDFIIGLSYYKQLQYKDALRFLALIKDDAGCSNHGKYLMANCYTLLHQHAEARELYLKVENGGLFSSTGQLEGNIYDGAQLKLGYLSFNVAEIRKKLNSGTGIDIKDDEVFSKSIADAMAYFSKITEKSRYYQDALMGKAWIEHNLGNYEKSNGYLTELTTKYPSTDFIYEAKTLSGFNKDLQGTAGDKNEDFEYVLNAQVELGNNEVFVSERLLIASLVTKLADTKQFLLEQNAPMTKFFKYQDAKDSLMHLIKQASFYLEKIGEKDQLMASLTDNSYRTKLLTAIINATKKEINRLNDLSAGLFDIQEKLVAKSNYKELVQLVIEKDNIQNLLHQADAINIFSDKKLSDVKSREVDIQRWSDLSFLKYVLSNLGIEELDKIERDLNQINLQLNRIDNQLNTLPAQ